MEENVYPVISFAEVDESSIKIDPTTLGLLKCKNALSEIQRYIEELSEYDALTIVKKDKDEFMRIIDEAHQILHIMLADSVENIAFETKC